MLSVYFGQGLCIIKCVIVLFFALTAGVLNEICCPERHNQWPLFYREAEHAHLVFPTELGRLATRNIHIDSPPLNIRSMEPCHFLLSTQPIIVQDIL